MGKGMNTLHVGGDSYSLNEVLLYVEPLKGRQEGLELNLWAGSEDLEGPGFAINCISLPGATGVAGLTLELGEQSTDGNELGESVICETGRVLELLTLRLTFGDVRDGTIPVTLDAECHRCTPETVRAHGELTARVAEGLELLDQA